MKLRAYMEIPNGYYKKLARVESSNNPNAKAKTSSATGLYQFIDSTWGNLVKEMGKDYTLEDRKDPKKSQEVIEYFTKKNEKYLKNKLDREPNEAELYLTHFLGMPRAGKLLKTIQDNPHTDISNVLPDNVIKANPFLKGKKAFEVYNWSAKKMGVSDYNIPKEKTRVHLEEYPEIKIDNTRVNLPPLVNTPLKKVSENDMKKVFKEYQQKQVKTNESNFINAFKQINQPIQENYNPPKQEDLSYLYNYIKLED